MDDPDQTVPVPKPVPKAGEKMTDSRFADLLQDGVAALDAETDDGHEAAGTMIGGYRLLEPVGEGGFGIVWRAEQKEPVRREAALKIIKPGMDSREIVARFEAERQALALMDHPNIARMFEGGTTATGRLYFAMEFVKGEPITLFCDERQLGLQVRIRLFMDVCAAVQHAHQKAIIHRDLKPSNILVIDRDDEFVPKVIDFGIAKALGQKLTENTMFTMAGTAVGTPQYMSPEQAGLRNQDVDTRTDVYALGVILYELLTGTTPLTREALRQMGVADLQEWIRESEPERPSTRVLKLDDETKTRLAKHHKADAAKLQRSLRGDLDWIVMRALEKDRNRRYQTVNGLAQDLRRYLEGEPVEAGPPSAGYRIGKFVRKNRAAFAAACGMVLSLVLGLGVAAWRFLEESKARQRSEQSEAMAAQSEAIAKSEKRRSEDMLTRMQLQRAEELFDVDDASGGIAYLSTVLRRNPQDRITGVRLLSALRDRSHGKLVAGPWTQPGAVAVGWMPDGKSLLIDSKDGLLRWPLQQPEPESNPIVKAARLSSSYPSLLLPDQQKVIMFHEYGHCCLYDVGTGAPMTPMLVHERSWTGMNPAETAGLTAALSPDGRWLVSIMASPNRYIWDVSTGKPVAKLEGWPTCVAFHPDGKTLAVGLEDGTVQLREVDGLGWKVRQQWKPSPGFVSSLRFTADRLLVLSHENLYLHQFRDGLVDAKSVPLGGVTSYDVAILGDVMVLGRVNHTVEVLSMSDGSLVAGPMDAGQYVRQVALTRDGLRLLVVTEQGIQMWSSLRGDLLCRSRSLGVSLLDNAFARPTIHLSPDGERVAVTQVDGTISVWQLTQFKALPIAYPLPGNNSSLGLDSSGERLATGNAEGEEVAVWSLRDGRLKSPIFKAVPKGGHVRHLAFQPTTDLLWIGTNKRPDSPGGYLSSWHWPDGSDAENVINLPGYVSRISFDEIGRRMMLVNTSQRVAVLQLPSLQASPGGWGDCEHVGGARLSNDGCSLTLNQGGRVGIWDVASGKQISSLMTESATDSRISFSKDGEVCVSLSESGAARVWSVRKQQPLGPPIPHQATITDASLHVPSEVLVTVCADHTAHLWRYTTGEALGWPLHHQEVIYDATISPDGKRVATSSYDGTIRLWDVPSGRPLTEAIRVLGQDASECIWHADSEKVITYGRSPVQCWDLPMVEKNAPAWLPEWAEAIGGLKLDAKGELRALPLDAEQRFQVMPAGSNSTGNDPYSRTLRWFYQPVRHRTISPEAVITDRERVAALCRTRHLIKDLWALDVTPDDPLAWASLLRDLERKDGIMTLPLTQSGWRERVMEKNKQDSNRAASAWLLEAMISKSGNAEQCITAAREALKLGLDEPWKSDCHSMLGSALMQLKHWDEAAAEFGRALDNITPSDRTHETRSRWVEQRRTALQHLNDRASIAADNSALLGISARAPDANPEQLDLTAFYNRRLDELLLGGKFGFRELPSGTSNFADVAFDVRALIQLRSRLKEVKDDKGYSRQADLGNPETVEGVPVESKCRKLHFMHCLISTTCAWGQQIGAYAIHYADGQEIKVPLRNRRELQDRHREWPSSLKSAPPATPDQLFRIAWKGQDEWTRGFQNRDTCAYIFTWENPRPDVPVQSIDLISNANDAGLCVFAITRE